MAGFKPLLEKFWRGRREKPELESIADVVAWNWCLWQRGLSFQRQRLPRPGMSSRGSVCWIPSCPGEPFWFLSR